MLTKQKAETAAPKDKEYSLFDSDGLYLRVLPSGRKTWYIRLYGIGGKITQKSLGQFPDIGLTEARKLRNHIMEEIKTPGDRLTLRQVGERWIKEYSEVSAKGMVYNHKLYLSYLGPILSKRAAVLTRKDLVDMLRIIQEDHSYETARRVGVALGQMYQHAVNSGLLSFSPAVRLSSALIRPEEPGKTSTMHPSLMKRG